MGLVRWWRLWRAGYCTCHAVNKTSLLDRATPQRREAIMSSMRPSAWRADAVWFEKRCELCEIEARQRSISRRILVVARAEREAARVLAGRVGR